MEQEIQRQWHRRSQKGFRQHHVDISQTEINGTLDADTISKFDKIALGCPSMGAEQLEDSEMEPFVEELEPMISGKQLLLFGSYGWGDGEWMRDWCQRMEEAGAHLICEEGVIANETPDDAALEECRAAGKELITALV